MLSKSEFDVIIVGGGMVGAAQALAFCLQGQSVLLVEKHLPQASWLDNTPLRVSAVNLFSEAYLTELGIWPHIQNSNKCVFNHLATWEQPNNKNATAQRFVFSAGDINKDHLGHLIRNEALQIAAYEALNQLPNPPVIVNADISNMKQSQERVTVELRDGDGQRQTVTSLLFVGADGANSQVRALANIGVSGWDYQQHCLSITIKTDFPMQDITWQEFQPSGPKAFLPLNDGYASLIWYDSPERIKQIKSLSNDAIKQQVLTTFPALAGDFNIIQFASFPLTRRQANQYVNGRIVLVGDAAHTINPLAGQGVNLGYKDVNELSEQLSTTDFANSEQLIQALHKYQRKRKAESLVMSGAMDTFYTLFSNDKTPLKMFRQSMLSVVNKLHWAKKQVLKKAVGY